MIGEFWNDLVDLATWVRTNPITAAVLMVIGWGFWLFKPHVIGLIARAVGTVWHLLTRHRLDDSDPFKHAIHKAMKIEEARRFFRVSR